uniref:tRNA pseudouridine(55) synthase n=1 Tax=Trypanosoma vivax (strain Y486) TaxID=1055687 RepID=G0UBM1_TRYVY|nr:conserved hypothetical protein [Trypanosoma vivax Y486]
MAQRDVLCYHCALRMSIMFQQPAPVPVAQLQSQKGGGNFPEKVHEEEGILLDASYHPCFLIAYTLAASERHLSDDSMNEVVISAPYQKNPRLCCACLGLYQFIDSVHAPTVAASVRMSPFVDSERISVNINAHRSMSFLWLAVAAKFYGGWGLGNGVPSPSTVIAEEHANFKDFFASDLRARVLQYLTSPHSELGGAKAPAGYKMYLREIERQAAQDDLDTRPRASQAFIYSPENEGVIVEVSAEHHKIKNLVAGSAVPCQYCSNRCEGVLTFGLIYDYVYPYLKQTGCYTGDTDARQTRQFLLSDLAAVSCALQHTNIMLIGNYRKMRRGLSQSPWFTNEGRVGTYSLQEIIANPILPFFFPDGVTSVNPTVTQSGAAEHSAKLPRHEASDAQASLADASSNDPLQLAAKEVFGHGRYKFHSAGREDVDVRMLGCGRPFVLEVIGPSRERVSEADLANFEQAVNSSDGGSVEISHLRVASSDVLLRLARHSESKVKKYRCVVWCSRAITNPEQDVHIMATNSVCDLTIEQRTPIRVLHRRSLHARKRVIHSLKLKPLNAHWFVMDLETQAGTYVKEFVHGDMGRTVPHLGQLLNARTDIVQLDVLDMAIEEL